MLTTAHTHNPKALTITKFLETAPLKMLGQNLPESFNKTMLNMKFTQSYFSMMKEALLLT